LPEPTWQPGRKRATDQIIAARLVDTAVARASIATALPGLRRAGTEPEPRGGKGERALREISQHLAPGTSPAEALRECVELFLIHLKGSFA